MGERDLHVDGHGDGVGNENVEEALRDRGDGFVDDEVAEPCPEEGLAGHFEPAVPPGGALSWALTKKDILP